MSRPMFLVFLLMILIFTSQFEWRQPLVTDTDAAPTVSRKQQQISNPEEVVKEKIILSQEKSIHKLNELVRSLKEQLSECRVNSRSTNTTLSRLPEMPESVIELERHPVLED
ncbi:hypothetical protein V2J09_011870 [Rumex salicifolius]